MGGCESGELHPIHTCTMNPASLQALFSPPADPALLTYGIYDPWLVVLSIMIAIFSSWMALHMAAHAANASTRLLRAVALLTGSLALGSGVWAMHFIGMLAFDLCTRVDYDRAITILSMLPSIAASFVALSLIGRRRIGGVQLLIGGVLVGSGIGAMHYAGMAALRSNLALRYDPLMFGLSIMVAVVLATLALWVRFGLLRLNTGLKQEWLPPISAVIMGFAIAGMHYTGMVAARFVGHVTPNFSAGTANVNFIALAVSLITIAFTTFVVAANGLLRYRAVFRQLSQSELWMRTLLATAVDGVVAVDADGIIQTFNASAERIFGWSQAEIVGRHVRLLMSDESFSEQRGLLGYLKNVDRDLVGKSNEGFGVRKDGSSVLVRNAYGSARLADRELFVCFVTDLSEREAMEQALRDSEQQFRSLIGNIPGISFRCLMQPERTMVFVSEAIERLSGYPAADFIGAAPVRHYGELIHPEDRERVRAQIETAIHAGHPFVIEYRLLHRDGHCLWMWEHGSALLDAAGKVKWLDGVILDIGERRRMEDDLRDAKERAEQAAAARAAFLANMSHEIRTPMNAILGFTDVLLQEELAPEQRRHLDTVRNAARSLLRLLNEVLDTAKLDKGAVELEVADFNLLGLIDELSSTLGAGARSRGLTLNIRYDNSLPLFFRGDELRVRQVLTNLLGNAIKFTEAGSIDLTVEPADQQLHFMVRDTGIGISADRLAMIFDPFTQADSSMSRRFGGTGLGTTISKQLTELMGGRIWVESTLGLGSVFHVLLPLEAARMTQQQGRQRDVVVLPPLRILVTDDVPQNIELLTLLLGRLGHNVIAASEGRIAVQLAVSERIDLILMDVQMPGMSGLEATRQIRAAEALSGRRRVPIIAMTASVLDADREAAQAAGMDGFASKPVDLVALTHEIAGALHLDPAVGIEPVRRPLGEPQLLDEVGALRRWSGERLSYQRALREFGSDLGSAATRFYALAEAGDKLDLHEYTHKLRGLAANLGLEQLAAVLARLEQQAVTEDAAALLGLVEELPKHLSAAHAAIAAHLALSSTVGATPLVASDAAAMPEQSFDAQRVRQLGAILMQAFGRGALDDAALGQLAAALGGYTVATRIDELQRALDDFDFGAAQTSLASLLSECPEPS